MILEIACGKPLDGTNTYPIPENLAMYYLDTYTYSCMEGYTTDDELYTVCQPDGTLSLADLPTCTGDFMHRLVHIDLQTLIFQSLDVREIIVSAKH